MVRSRFFKTIWVSVFLIFLTQVGYGETTTKESIISFEVYKDLELLTREGLLIDYPVDWVKSGHILSRIEIAYYLKKVIINRLENRTGDETLSIHAIDALQRLMVEFRKELSDLGIETTDIYQVSPKLNGIENGDGYQDLDILLFPEENKEDEPCYYLGWYYNDLDRKSFIFVPQGYTKKIDYKLLEGSTGTINIVYQPKRAGNPSFLVVKGELPVGKNRINGFYLFPITKPILKSAGNQLPVVEDISDLILVMLDEVNQIQRIENLRRFPGSLSFEGYLRLETNWQNQLLLGSLSQGLKLGGLFIYTDNPSNKLDYQLNNFGLPFYDIMQNPVTAPMDLDLITGKNFQALQINIRGTVELSPQASLYGGLDLLYRDLNIKLIDPWPSDTKASAGVFYHLNPSWTFLTYQSLVNSKLNPEWLSTTSFGVEYDHWVTLWLAYQFLKFDDPVVTGALSFRF